MLVPLLRRVFPVRRASRRCPAHPGLELLESRFVLSPTRLPPVLVNPGNSAPGTDPGEESPYTPPGVSVAENAAGDFVVAWSTSAACGEILAQRFDPVGNPLGAVITVATHVAQESSVGPPAVGMDSAGDFVVAWSSDGNIFASRYNAAGASLDASPFQVDTSGFEDFDPAVALDDQGHFVIAYAGASDCGFDVCAQQGFDSGSNPLASGKPVTIALAPFSDSVYYATPAVSADAAGDFVVAYQTLSFSSTFSTSVDAQRVDAAGSLLGSAITLSNSGTASSPSVAVARSSGTFAVTWVDDASGSPVLMAETFNASGTSLTAPFALNPAADPPSAQAYDTPAVAVDATGDFVAIWAVHAAPAESEPGVRPDGGPSRADTEPTGEVYVQTFGANGSLTGGPSTLTLQPNAPGPTAVAMDSTGDYVGVFAASQQTEQTASGPTAAGNSYNIIAVIFRNVPVVPPPVVPPPVVPPPLPPPPPSSPPPRPSQEPAIAIALLQTQEEDETPEAIPIVPPSPEVVIEVVRTQQTAAIPKRADLAAVLVEQVGGNNAVGTISGQLFSDLNGDGIFGPDKPALAGRLVFLDLNNNGVIDEGEPVTVTNSNGEYSFSGLSLQTYQVRQLLPRGDTQTLPAENHAWEVRLDNSQHDVGGRNFGNLYVPLRVKPTPLRTVPGSSPSPPATPQLDSDDYDDGDEAED
jgi:hypothetical protein